jgi:hypothetical protein
MDFIDVERPELGGTIRVLVEGMPAPTPGNAATDLTRPVMLDNMTVTESGLVVMQEDPGNNPRLAKICIYDPTKDDGSTPNSGLTEIAQHDPARFLVPGTPAPGSVTGTFNQDEESSGIIEVTEMLGGGDKLAFMLDTQAHYA